MLKFFGNENSQVKRGTLIAVAAIIYSGLVGCDMSSDGAVFEQTLGDGTVVRVSQIPGGPVGPEFSYVLDSRAADAESFVIISTWEMPPGEADINIYEIDSLVIVVTPPRDNLIIRDSSGRWQPWAIRDFVIQARNEARELILPPRHEPAAKIHSIDVEAYQASVDLTYAGWPAQKMRLEIAKDGSNVEIVSAQFPDDPRSNYLESHDSINENELLVIARELSGDGQTDLLVSHRGATNGKAGNIWYAYIAAGNAFTLVPTPMSIRLDSVSGWTPTTTDKNSAFFSSGITTYHPKSASSGTIMMYSVDSGLLVTDEIAVGGAQSTEINYERVFSSDFEIPIMHTPQ